METAFAELLDQFVLSGRQLPIQFQINLAEPLDIVHVLTCVRHHPGISFSYGHPQLERSGVRKVPAVIRRVPDLDPVDRGNDFFRNAVTVSRRMGDDRKTAHASYLVDRSSDPFFADGFPDPHAKKVNPFILWESVFEPRNDLDAVPGVRITIATKSSNGFLVHEVGVVRHADKVEPVLLAEIDKFPYRGFPVEGMGRVDVKQPPGRWIPQGDLRNQRDVSCNAGRISPSDSIS